MRKELDFVFSVFFKGGLIVLLHLLLTGCNKDNASNHSYKVNIDTVRFKISPQFLDYYVKYDILDEENLFVGYNHFDNSVQFIDLFNKKTKHTIELATDGPDRIKTISELFITQDKIFLKASLEWIIIDHEGKILERFNFSDLAQDLDNKYVIDGGLSISYLQKKELSLDQRSVFVKLFPLNVELNSPEFYEGPLFCKLDFYSKSVEIDPYLPYPEIFRSGTDYGILDKPTILERDDGLIYSFPNHSTIYVYDFDEQSISANEVKSEKINSVIEVNQNGSLQDIIKSSFRSNRFHPITYDKFQDLYYRVIRVKNDTKDENEYFLQIIDSQFIVVEEIYLSSEKVDRNRYEVTKEGLYFQLMSSRGNIFSYMLIDVQVER